MVAIRSRKNGGINGDGIELGASKIGVFHAIYVGQPSLLKQGAWGTYPNEVRWSIQLKLDGDAREEQFAEVEACEVNASSQACLVQRDLIPERFKQCFKLQRESRPIEAAGVRNAPIPTPVAMVDVLCDQLIFELKRLEVGAVSGSKSMLAMVQIHGGEGLIVSLDSKSMLLEHFERPRGGFTSILVKALSIRFEGSKRGGIGKITHGHFSHGLFGP
ncbi:hypothetical protein [Pseudomonas sp. PDM17]|uniref:hypothetical protein n=1 Tax=Pseudomonas sp. PDM17 TaxID=2769285 RepID=UPI001CE1EFF4|nr:hypothetical protein [Pseudomonas sp. PDM17]